MTPLQKWKQAQGKWFTYEDVEYELIKVGFTNYKDLAPRFRGVIKPEEDLTIALMKVTGLSREEILNEVEK